MKDEQCDLKIQDIQRTFKLPHLIVEINVSMSVNPI